MKKICLNQNWQLSNQNEIFGTGNVPCSVYSIMLENGKMEDPYFRDNELKALQLMDNDYIFTKTFTLELDNTNPMILHCDGLDTICTITINGNFVGKTLNMHRTYEFNIEQFLRDGENEISIKCDSPVKWIKSASEKDYIGGTKESMVGFPHLRKAHCMFGWDWGPRLPDAGIWRDIYILEENSSRIEDVYIKQNHDNGNVSINVRVEQSKFDDLCITLTTPKGEIFTLNNNEDYSIKNPELWWPHGYGEQALYTVKISLSQNGEITDFCVKRIGLRTATMNTQEDEFGTKFCHQINGVDIFAMGADYIPEDNILARVTEEKTRSLLEHCVAINFNCIRVWGGGYYPNDFFFDICDELGLLVWEDFMYACAHYRLTEDFEENIKAELIDNIKRIRHHACLGLWCGNNEMEQFEDCVTFDATLETRKDYLIIFEHLFPKLVKQYSPQVFYWPASPSSKGSFIETNSENHGDVHYWDVWHGNQPFHSYRKFYFRYCSEFGFQSFPSLKTVETFTLPEDRNIFSRVMEMHQRNSGANGKILNYLSSTYLYPNSFDKLLYASQLLQAEAIKYGVEHWRRNRGRCMGAVYWQLNDIWPVASWASLDYFQRWKALHYFAKRFFAPILISAEEIGETSYRESIVQEASEISTKARLNIANETMNDVCGTINWALRDNTSKVIKSGSLENIKVPALTSTYALDLDFGCCEYLSEYLSYEFIVADEIVSKDTVLFTAPKHFKFLDPEISTVIDGDTIKLTSKNYAKCVEIYSPDTDFILSDNFFDMGAETTTIKIVSGKAENILVRSVYDIK